LVESDDFLVDRCVFGKISQGFGNERELAVERLAVSRVQEEIAVRSDCLSSILIQFDFFCGVRRYVAVEHGTSH